MNTKEKQELHRQYTYHAQCEMWYVAAAAARPQHKDRILRNAEFHKRNADHLLERLNKAKGKA